MPKRVAFMLAPAPRYNPLPGRADVGAWAEAPLVVASPAPRARAARNAVRAAGRVTVVIGMEIPLLPNMRVAPQVGDGTTGASIAV
jgi:hypothetical protein